EAQSSEIRFGDGAPAAVPAEDGQHMIVVADGFEVEQQRLESLDSQRRRAEQRSFETLGQPVAQDAARAAAGGPAFFLVVGNLIVQKSLNPLGRAEPAQDGELSSEKTIGAHCLTL